MGVVVGVVDVDEGVMGVVKVGIDSVLGLVGSVVGVDFLEGVFSLF